MKAVFLRAIKPTNPSQIDQEKREREHINYQYQE